MNVTTRAEQVGHKCKRRWTDNQLLSSIENNKPEAQEGGNIADDSIKTELKTGPKYKLN